MIFNFHEKASGKLSQVGGKAKALMETTCAGFPVPEGIVLSVKFFESWLREIKYSKAFEEAMKDTTKDNCDKVKEMAQKFSFNNEQKRSFDNKIKEIDGEIFAVRSSSPEEDLEGKSFAGMYETFLGTRRRDIEKRVAHAFASCFDYRVMEYKKMNGMNLKNTTIAVVVQKQIASEISGVGFSLNPMNNAYDEVMINASFGLGEAIVSGIVTPDVYIYDSVEQSIIEKKIKDKEVSLLLKSDGGIEEKRNKNGKEEALKDKQIEELARMIKDCEKFYGKPIDTEWAYEGGKLYLLQARPITTYLPLFTQLLTEPGEKKKFYLDLMIMTQGFDEPMSVLGMELWSKMIYEIKGHMLSPHIGGTTPAVNGRQYISFTDMQKLIGKKNTAKIFGTYDRNVKKIMGDIDIESNFPDKKPEGTSDFKKQMFKMSLKMVPGMFKSVYLNHESMVEEYEKTVEKIINDAKNLDKDEDFNENAKFISEQLVRIMGTITIMLAGMLAKESIKKMFKGEDVEKEITALSMDLKGNPTSEMGYLLLELASTEDFKNTDSRETFARKCKEESYSVEFMNLYKEFMKKFSVRGMKEIDVASKRIHEDIRLLYDKLIDINTEDNQMIGVKEKREAAYNKLLEAARKKGKEKKFVKAAQKYQALFGYREHPKYMIVYILSVFHDMCIEFGRDWVKEGRLEKAYDVFDLGIQEIARAQKDKSFDMKKAREKNLQGYKKVEHVKEWPLVIDSRGKIYKPKMEIQEGDIMGEPIAPGKVTGRAKVLRTPYEKTLEPGEILIARATEPSWTPIFINAAGVIMEIGGPLQHGGIIAREYGIPCVSGLIGIMDIVKDGDLIEVDGYNGKVKILES